MRGKQQLEEGGGLTLPARPATLLQPSMQPHHSLTFFLILITQRNSLNKKLTAPPPMASQAGHP